MLVAVAYVPLQVNVPAIPSVELVAGVSVLVALIVTLNRLAMPESTDVPLNAQVPALHVSEPAAATLRSFSNVKLLAEVTEPPIYNPANVQVPLLVIVFADPFIDTTDGAEAMNEFETFRLPAIVNELLLVTDPLIVRLQNANPDPEIVLVAPLIVSVPLLLCVNEAPAAAERFPATVILVAPATVTPLPLMVKLLKVVVPLPLTAILLPASVIVEVEPVSVPLLVKSPLNRCD